MIKYLRNISPAKLKNKICLLRLDFNTEDNWRLEASLPTIKFLAKNCRAVVILSHKGRPLDNAQGKPAGFDRKFSLRANAGVLSKDLKKTVVFTPHFRFQEIGNLVRSSPAGSVFLLENLRFLKEEEENNSVLGEHLASVGDFYVNDAFAVSHRTNASVVALAKLLPSYAGLELEAEIKNLSRVMKNPKEPLVVILGGSKIEDKLGVYENLKKKAAAFLIGGALNEKLIKKLRSHKKLLLPSGFKKERGIVQDIDFETAEKFCLLISKAKTILWNGPMGNIDNSKYRNTTRIVAQCIAKNKKAFKIVGGGETVMFLKKLKLDKKIDFISTGGGALLDFLAGKKLPGIEALK